MFSSITPISDNTKQSAIVWPLNFQPGTTDNFTSNEVIAQGITVSQIWAQLNDISKWPFFYPNCSDITPPVSGPWLKKGDIFRLSMFGLPVLECQVKEFVPPSSGQAGRIGWSGTLEGGEDDAMEVYHAWLVENLPNERVRILTQASQIGKPAAGLASKKPNIVLLGHQDWLDGLVVAAEAIARPVCGKHSPGTVFHDIQRTGVKEREA